MTVELRPLGVACNLACTYCLPAGSPVVDINGRMVNIENLRVGDEIIAFDEFPTPINRKFKRATITATMNRMVAGYRVITEHGVFVSSGDHMWVNGKGAWSYTKNLKVGDSVVKVMSYPVPCDNIEMPYVLSRIVEISEVEEQVMYDVTTTAGTLIAYGFASHNCYQEPMREFGQKPSKIDVDKMLDIAESTGHDFSLFGGEALLTPKKILDKIWARGYELYGKNGVQTNGTLIDDDHIEMFKKYNVSVGISIDGPNELNGLREVRGKAGDDEKTLESTDTILENIRKCAYSGVGLSIIITLHRLNGTGENLGRLMNFIRWLKGIGVKYGNIHVLEVDKTMPDQEKHVLTQEENIEAFLLLAEFFENDPDLTYSPFKDIKKAFRNEYNDYNILINGKEKTVRDGLVCFFNRCDSMNTQAVFGVEGSGQITNCGRTNKEGIDLSKAKDQGFERYFSLYNTPQSEGGCGGCPYFLLCSGGCPGEGADYDMRNKTIHCKTNQKMFEFYEKAAIDDGIIPFSKMDGLKDMEGMLMNNLMSGKNIELRDLLQHVEENPIVRNVEVLEFLEGDVNIIEISE